MKYGSDEALNRRNVLTEKSLHLGVTTTDIRSDGRKISRLSGDQVSFNSIELYGHHAGRAI